MIAHCVYAYTRIHSKYSCFYVRAVEREALAESAQFDFYSTVHKSV